MSRTNSDAAANSKGYSPADTEREVMAVWNGENLFHAEPTDPGKPYSIVIPPPNVTAALHLGHALNNTLQDILIRYHRLLGDNAVWLPGTDHAGIATQTVVEKRVLKEEGKKRTEFEREDFVAKIQAWKDEYEQTITNQLKAMGCSCDWDRQAFTMDEPRAKAVREAFFQLFKDGLIYRGKRLVNWDPVTLTALADDEVENEEVDGFFYYLRYPLEDGSGYVTVATTRPETMLGDTAVAINPKDPRAVMLRGKRVRLPIVGRVIPIVEDDYVVMADPNGDDPKAKFATGFLKVTPAHDPNDYEIGKRHDLPVINVMAPDASISDKHGWTDIGEAGFVLGEAREKARESIVEWFRRHGLLEDVKPYRHSVGHSYRSHVPIEPYLSDQWYCKVTDPKLAGAALAAMAPDQVSRNTGVPPVPGAAQNDESSPTEDRQHGRDARVTTDHALRFYPNRYAKTFQSWHENIRDWCISRQLWWGHRIPVWKRTSTTAYWELEEAAFEDKIAALINAERIAELKIAYSSTSGDSAGRYVCVREESDLETIQFLYKNGFNQDDDVLDTWFSSGLWPLSTLGWPDHSSFINPHSSLNTWNPTSVLCTAREIITLWVSRMVMFNLYFLNRLPFEDVFIHAMIQDGEGRKMSKSLGNGVDPLDIIHSHGTDALRFTLASMATNTQDVRMPVEKDPATGRNTSPKFDEGKKFCNKIWQVAGNFVIPNLTRTAAEPLDQSKWSLADRWIVSRFNRTLEAANAGIAAYRFDVYAKACYDFFWEDFCNWYVETTKPALRDPDRAGQTAAVLAAVLDGTLRLMHPIIPFITEALWWKLNDARVNRSSLGAADGQAGPQPRRLVRASWPSIGVSNGQAESAFANVQSIIVAIRNLRNEYKVDPKKPLKVTIITPEQSASADPSQAREVIELMAACKLVGVGSNVQPAEKAAKAVTAGVEIYVEGLVDEGADQQRNVKRREELMKQETVLTNRLNNAGYVARAPAKLVQETKDALAAVQEELSKLQS